MAQIIQFTPKKELSAQRNLQDLITLSRDHLVTWANLPGFEWSNSYRPTSSRGIKFTDHENRSLHPSKPPSHQRLMSAEFTEFAKAYVRYRHTIKPHRNIAREMQALRALEVVLRRDQGVPGITKVNQRQFELAVAELDVYKAHAFIVGELLNILKMLADFFYRQFQHPLLEKPLCGEAIL
jgi:hypothetical protein